MKIPKNARIIIIEGIPGAGKNTFHDELKEKIKNKFIYDFDEGELLFSWKHAWINGIDKIRLDFMNKLLDYCESVLKKSDTFFIINRFHISFYVLRENLNKKVSEKYKRIISRLKKLPVHIFVPIVSEDEIEKRASHTERKGVWEMHLKRRLKQRGFSNLRDMYTLEQKRILELLKSQCISYSVIKVL